MMVKYFAVQSAMCFWQTRFMTRQVIFCPQLPAQGNTKRHASCPALTENYQILNEKTTIFSWLQRMCLTGVCVWGISPDKHSAHKVFLSL